MSEPSARMVIFPAGTHFHAPDDSGKVTIQFPDADSAIVFFEWCRQWVIAGEQEQEEDDD